MSQSVSVYLKPGCFLLYPNSMIGLRGPRIGEPPGVGITAEADDSALGQMVRLVSTWSRTGLLPRNLRTQPVPFFLSPLAGLKTWAALTRSSPATVSIDFLVDGIVIHKFVREGLGYTADIPPSLQLPLDTSVSVIGATVRRLLAPAK